MTNDSQMFSKYIQSNEIIKWTGKPPEGLLLRKSDIYMIPFSLLWGGFAIFWEATAYTSGAPFFFLIFGSFFVIMGLYMILGRFILDIVKRKYTYYALTNDRALILSTLLGQSIKSLDIKSIPEISINLKSNNKGTIIFGNSSGIQSMFTNSSWPGARQDLPQFESIDNANQVYRMIQEVKK